MRQGIIKTYKLFIGGAFPRSESGRALPVLNRDGSVFAECCKASRKDLREAVTAARKALGPWGKLSAYDRGQIIYRMAEMVQSRRGEFAELLMLDAACTQSAAEREIDLAADRLVAFAGWADKVPQVLGAQNPVVGPYWNITTPVALGCVGIVPVGDTLLGLLTLVGATIATGNTVVVLTSANAAPVSSLGEALATSDLPGGVINILTGDLAELVPVLAGHRDVDGILASGLPDDLVKVVQLGAAENLKRIALIEPAQISADAAHATATSLRLLEASVEAKTVWHPVGI